MLRILFFRSQTGRLYAIQLFGLAFSILNGLLLPLLFEFEVLNQFFFFNSIAAIALPVSAYYDHKSIQQTASPTEHSIPFYVLLSQKLLFSTPIIIISGALLNADNLTKILAILYAILVIMGSFLFATIQAYQSFAYAFSMYFLHIAIQFISFICVHAFVLSSHQSMALCIVALATYLLVIVCEFSFLLIKTRSEIYNNIPDNSKISFTFSRQFIHLNSLKQIGSIPLYITLSDILRSSLPVLLFSIFLQADILAESRTALSLALIVTSLLPINPQLALHLNRVKVKYISSFRHKKHYSIVKFLSASAISLIISLIASKLFLLAGSRSFSVINHTYFLRMVLTFTLLLCSSKLLSTLIVASSSVKKYSAAALIGNVLTSSSLSILLLLGFSVFTSDVSASPSIVMVLVLLPLVASDFCLILSKRLWVV